MVRLVRWYLELPQAGQRRDPPAEESVAAPCSATSGSEISPASLKALLIPAKGDEIASFSQNFNQAGNL
jgi:hypothetical protein